jgi:cation transport regulator ChaC
VGGLTEHVFAYGSVVGDGPASSCVPATLRGHRRIWGVAADNARAIPGYKQYRLREDGSLPRVFVAFLDVVEHRSCAVNGVVAPVDEAALALLDRRERNYDRVDVTAIVDTPVEGRVWTYVGSPAGRERLAAGTRDGRAVVCREYVEGVHSAFRELGDAAYAAFLASSELDGLPVLDLDRVDLPPAGPRA